MGFKLKIKDLQKAYKVLSNAAPIALVLAEAVLPNTKLIGKASKVVKVISKL